MKYCCNVLNIWIQSIFWHKGELTLLLFGQEYCTVQNIIIIHLIVLANTYCCITTVKPILWQNGLFVGGTNSLYFPSKEFPSWTFPRGTVNKTIFICINICNNNSIFYNNNNYKNVPFGFVQFQKVFRSWLFVTSWRVELLIWAFLPEERARARIDRSESKSESALINALYLAALHEIHSGSMSLKKCVFVCEGKITSGCSLFFGAATEFLKRVCWWTFYKPGPVRRWICTWFDTERWSGPSYERSRSWFRTSDGKWKCIKYGFCWRLEQMLVTL